MMGFSTTDDLAMTSQIAVEYGPINPTFPNCPMRQTIAYGSHATKKATTAINSVMAKVAPIE